MFSVKARQVDKLYIYGPCACCLLAGNTSYVLHWLLPKHNTCFNCLSLKGNLIRQASILPGLVDLTSVHILERNL
jgi:hypothetical protein